MTEELKTYALEEVLREEDEALRQRRLKMHGEEAARSLESTRFGLALSGGGIRSATINLGFLSTLNRFHILEKADYLSTVSGGGYTGGYVHTTLKKEGSYDALFQPAHIERLRSNGEYMIPGQQGIRKMWNAFLLVVGYLSSLLMSWVGPAIFLILVFTLYKICISWYEIDDAQSPLNWSNPDNQIWTLLLPLLETLGAVLVLHLLTNVFMRNHLSVSKWWNWVESILLVAVLAFLAAVLVVSFDPGSRIEGEEIGWAVLLVVGLFFAGFLTNPNALSFHRYYRKQLADTFLAFAGEYKNLWLKDLFSPKGEAANYLNPYPLVNTCLNLQNPGGDEKFKGAKASDYFLLSPLFCGSKLSRYVATARFPGYRKLTFPSALTVSAAAVNPGMGIYSNRLLSMLMTIFNARLGIWVNNPSYQPPRWLRWWPTYWVWWPSYFFKELLSNIGTRNRKLNISDGGHIENLAVYELLRRRCRLILAVDAGADPDFSFSDLENLAMRARNELGIEIAFRPGQDPVDCIFPKPSSGYSRRRFAIADLYRLWEEFFLTDANGEPVTYQPESKGKKNDSQPRKVEVLVNYFRPRKEGQPLKFRVDLKLPPKAPIDPETRARWEDRARQQAEQRLQARSASGADPVKVGTLVYVKSSVTPPRKLFVPPVDAQGRKNLKFDTFKYKIYHPEFPHESTADQFFDPVQWESYFQLGRYIAADVLDLPQEPEKYERGQIDLPIEKLIAFFDGREPTLFPAVPADGKTHAFRPEHEAAPAEELELEMAAPAPPPPTAPPVEEKEEMQFRI